MAAHFLASDYGWDSVIDIGWCNSGLGSGFSLKGTSCNLQGGSEIGPGLRLPVSVANVEPRRVRIRDNASPNRSTRGQQ